MDISSWSIGQIMQLPDCLFGRRFPIACCAYGAQGALAWDIAEIAFPERFVLWNVSFVSNYIDYQSDYIRMAMGDQLPAAAGEMDLLEPLLPGLGADGMEPRQIYIARRPFDGMKGLRNPYQAAGRRFVLEVQPVAEQGARVMVVLIVSSMPREIPDWYFQRQV